MNRIVFVKLNKEELYHYGVLGMHWGEWNAETAARYGTKEQKRAFKSVKQDSAMRKEFNNKGNTATVRAILSETGVNQAYKKVTDINKPVRKYYDDESVRKKYAEKAADLFIKNENISDPDEKMRIKNGYLYGDFDQGTNNSYTLYVNDLIKNKKVPKDFINRQYKISITRY